MYKTRVLGIRVSLKQRFGNLSRVLRSKNVYSSTWLKGVRHRKVLHNYYLSTRMSVNE